MESPSRPDRPLSLPPPGGDPPAPPGSKVDEAVAVETTTPPVAGRAAQAGLPRTPGLLSGFRALRHRDFRLFFSGQLVSLMGTWMQSLAQSWLVLTLTNSPFALGLVGALQFLPVLFLSPFGGTIADRVPKRTILMLTQTTMMLLAFILATLVVTKLVTYPEILGLAFCLGLANSIDMPTRQAFVVEMVGREDLMNAIALNSTLFNLARLIGPAIGGLLIAAVGIAACFFINGLSFVAVLFGLFLIHPRPAPPRRSSSVSQVLGELSEGFSYVRHTPAVMAIILMLGAIGTFGVNFNVILPLLAKDTLNVGAVGFGWLTAAMGCGSLISSLLIAYLAKEPRPQLILGAVISFSVFELVLAPVRSFPADLAFLACVAASQTLFASQSNTFVQLAVPNELRGRVMAIYMMFWAGTTPIGNSIIGLVAESTGTFGPFLLGGVASLAAVIAAFPIISKARGRSALQAGQK